MGVHFLTVVYLYFPLYFLLELKKLGPHFLFFLIAVIAIGDSGAYFVGSAIGQHKIYPLASPKKSLEGLLAAVATAALSGWLSILVFPVPVKPITAVWTAAPHRFVFPDFGSGRIPVQTGGQPEGFGHVAARARGSPGSARQLYILRAAALLPDRLVLEVKGIAFG